MNPQGARQQSFARCQGALVIAFKVDEPRTGLLGSICYPLALQDSVRTRRADITIEGVGSPCFTATSHFIDAATACKGEGVDGGQMERAGDFKGQFVLEDSPFGPVINSIHSASPPFDWIVKE